MYKTILIATDLEQASHDMLKKAMTIANQLNATIYLLHVIEPPTSTQYAASLGFAEYTSPVADDAKVVIAALGDEFNIPSERQLVKIGAVKTHIHDVAQELAADLIMIGSHSKPGLNLLGSTANAVIQNASCDVLTIRSAIA